MKRHRLLTVILCVATFFAVQFPGKAQAAALGEISTAAIQTLMPTGVSGPSLGAVTSLAGMPGVPEAGIFSSPQLFFTRLITWSNEMSGIAQQIATAETTLSTIMGTNSIFGKVYKTASAFAPYVKALDSFRNMYDATEAMYNTCKSTYMIIDEAIAAGTMSVDEATLLMESCASALRSVGQTGKFISDVLMAGNMSVFDMTRFINDFVMTTKLREMALKAYGERTLKRLYDKVVNENLDQMEFAFIYGDPNDIKLKKKTGKNAGAGILSEAEVKAVMEAAKGDAPTLEEVKSKTFKKEVWTGFGKWLYAVYALIWMGYLAWTFIREKGNMQNHDRWIKILNGLVYGILIIALFNNVVVGWLIGK